MDETIIGKAYTPWDNSWAFCVNTGKNTSVYGRRFILLSKPFKRTVGFPYQMGIESKIYDFVRVVSLDDGMEYECLFREDWILSDCPNVPKDEIDLYWFSKTDNGQATITFSDFQEIAEYFYTLGMQKEKERIKALF